MYVRALTGLVIAFVLTAAPATYADDLPWTLETDWTSGDPTLEYFKSEKLVLNRIKEIEFAWGADGPNRFDSNKPRHFKWWREEVNLDNFKSRKEEARVDFVDSSSATRSSTQSIKSTLIETTHPPRSIESKRPGNDAKVKKNFVMWLEREQDGEWGPVPNKRFEYNGVTEKEFKQNLEIYERAVESENKKSARIADEAKRRGETVRTVRLRVRWEIGQSTAGSTGS